MIDPGCNWPENRMSIDTDGWTRACCGEGNEKSRISHISDGIKIAFDHPKLLKLNEDLKAGYSAKTRSNCYRCENLEIRGAQSLRTITPRLSPNRELKMIQFKMSNKCQLTCAHCCPELSSGWAKLLNITPYVHKSFEITPEFIAELVELLPDLEIIKFTGGEPFLDPDHWKMLRLLGEHDRSHCRIEYITNGLVKPQHNLWQGWKEVTCSVSADGYKDSYEWFRRGANWQELVESVDNLSKYSTVSINYSLTPYTIQDYHKSMKFWKYPFSCFPISSPLHASFFKFPRSIVEMLPDYESIPHHTISIADNSNIGIYVKWAKDWDVKWNTVGHAEQIYHWVK
jgi:organic radical activating enzyme